MDMNQHVDPRQSINTLIQEPIDNIQRDQNKQFDPSQSKYSLILGRAHKYSDPRKNTQIIY